MAIDVAFDFRTDTPRGRDPDQRSPTLRRYHQLLWSKRLPSGPMFQLSAATPGSYLYHDSPMGEFWLKSDSVMQTFTRWKRMRAITGQLADEENDFFATITYTIGGMMLFPGNPIDGRWTINQARGCLRSIADRFDLTLECIRSHYQGDDSPLAPYLALYPEFFRLFGDFSGYVEFFLLDDLIRDGQVQFFTPFSDFSDPALPRDLDAYVEFRRSSIEFVEARNRRIQQLNL